MNHQKVQVDSEWGKLKETLVGTVGNLTVPVWTDEYEFVPPEEQRFVRHFGDQVIEGGMRAPSTTCCTVCDGLAK